MIVNASLILIYIHIYYIYEIHFCVNIYTYICLYIYIWADRNRGQFNTGKCRVLRLGRSKPMPLGWTKLESNFAEKDLGVLVGHQGENEPTVFPCSKEGKYYPGSALVGVLAASWGRWSFCSIQHWSGALGPVLDLPVWERIIWSTNTGENPMKHHKHNKRLEYLSFE